MFYFQTILLINKILAEENTKSCQYMKTAENFWSSPVYTLLRKNSPYTEAMSRG